MTANSGSGPRTKVLYIAGWGRSGTTILETVLGQVDGLCSAGELRWLWDRGLTEGWPCGCGSRVEECLFWKRVIAEAFSGGFPDLDAAVRVRAGQLRTRDARRVAQMTDDRRLDPTSSLFAYGELLGRLYAAIGVVSGANVVIDSSKYPADAVLVSSLDDVELYVVHVVRDPRAVAYSWSRRKPSPGRPGDAHMRRRGPVDSSLRWTGWNTAIATTLRPRLAGRYMMLRYEDFVADPETTLHKVLDFIGEPTKRLPLAGPHSVELATTHTVCGNPSRFQTGTVELRPDDEWRWQMGRRARLLASIPALLSLRRYGYYVNASGHSIDPDDHDTGAGGGSFPQSLTPPVRAPVLHQSKVHSHQSNLGGE